MSVAEHTPVAESDPAEPAPKAGRRWRAHLLVAVLTILAAVYVTHGLWLSPDGNVLTNNVGDQTFFEWVLSYGVYLLHHGGNPWHTTLMNAPHGVNLAANTSVLPYAFVFSPLTMLAGPQVTFVTVLTLNLAGSAFAWYLFLGRYVVRSRVAAGVAGMFCGFAPGFISHANGHLNWTSGWIAPLALWALLRLRQPGKWLRNGIVLGVVLPLGFMIAAEGLFFTALAGGIFVLVWSSARAVRVEVAAAWRTVAAALTVTAVVAGALLAYPLYMLFLGPETFAGTGFDQLNYSEDPSAYVSYADRTIAAGAGFGDVFAANTTEQTTYFGWPLIIMLLVSFVILWRRSDKGHRATLRALAIVGVVFVIISFGPRLRYHGKETHIPMLYALLKKLPLFDSALPTRFGLVLVGVFGIVIALMVDELLGKRPFAWAGLVAGALTLSLVPLLPLSLLYTQRAPEPKFISDGTWAKYVPNGGVMTAIPFALNVSDDAQRWQAYTMARNGPQFRIPDGYFLGPDHGTSKVPGRIGAEWRNTDWLFLRAGFYGYVANISNQDRASARADFAYWGLDAIFMPDSGEITGPHGPLDRDKLEIAATDLLGPPRHVDGVLLWRIRPGIDPVDR